MQSITRLQRRLGVLSAIAVITAGGFVLAGPELGSSDTVGGVSTVSTPASLAPFGIHELHGMQPVGSPISPDSTTCLSTRSGS